MSDWMVWGISRWNERLLAHFFSRRSDNDGPVTTLLATQEEIARATGDTTASPDAVHDAFIATALRTVRNGSLLETAADYLGYPAPPLDDQTPPFVWCLIFTCIAAAESSEDLADERSFVARLRRLTNDRLSDPSLQILPRLWENLAAWLANPTNTIRYRQLRLPDRGGLTRIGYTTKLAFPDRRDQRQLSELLDTEGLLGHEPPIGKVVSLVARERARFRDPFLDAMAEFRGQLTAGTSGASRLLEHRFWSAVREAAVRGRGRADVDLELRCRVQLLAEVPDDQLSLIAVSDEAPPADGVLASIELPVSHGPWRYAVVGRSDAGSLDGAAFERIVLSLLTLAHRIAPLSGYIEQGILPFLETNHGLLELAPMNAIGAAQIALVKREHRDDLVRLFGTARTRIAASRYEGWVQIECPNFASVASDQLEPTSLRRAWMLHRSVTRLAVTLSGGIATDDGWLGLREVLPTVQAPGATSVTARRAGGDGIPLLRVGDGWSFPRRDFVGSYDLEVATSDDDMVRRTVRFSLYPTHEEYKEAADPTAWIVEGVGSTSATTRTIPFLAGEPADDARGFADSTIYLGRGLGEFVHDATAAAWSISDFGSVRVGRRGRPELAAVPTVQSANPKSRRYWRKLLLQSAVDPNDAQFRDARHMVRQHVQRGGLPEVEFAAFEETEHIGAAEPHRSLDRLVGAVAARANSRCGMSWWEWSLLVQQLLGLDPHHVGPVTRAWQEVAAIDVLSASRWRHRCVFARRPCLVSYRCGLQIGATLIGLTLASTRLRLVEVVRRAGFALEERGSVSPFVPPTVALRVDRMKQLEELARATGIRVATVDLAIDGFRSAGTHDLTSPAPVAYHWSKRWPTWSLSEPETPPGPEVVHWLRDDRPGYWRVSHNDRTVWSYDLNVARWWAARLAGRDAIKTVGTHQLEAHHAYLPLPIARVMSVFARMNHGPEPLQSWRYRYPLVTPQLRKEVLAALLAAFDLQHLQGA